MNIGILGTGSIARTMAAEFAKVPAFRCEAVCSRQQATGEALAQQFGIPKVYTDYDAMLADPDIELVYIATPNSLHYAQTKAALLAGKNVLCDTVLHQEACQCAVTAAVGVNDFRMSDFAVHSFIKLELLGVTEVLKDLTVFIGNCNFHNGISFASFA